MITYVVTASVSVGFFQGQVAYMVGSGWDVDFVSSGGPELNAMRIEGARIWEVPMEREIAPVKDIVSLWRLRQLFRRTRPALVVAGTPKAGLLATLAARLAGIHRVVYMLHGLRLETARGPKRALLSVTEWIASHAAHEVRCVGPSLRAKAISLGLVTPDRCSVIGSGTVNGIDDKHWLRGQHAVSLGIETRWRLNIPSDSQVVGFVGRLTRDKGIADLYQAFSNIRTQYPKTRLLLVGDFESGDPILPSIRKQIESDSTVVVTGFVSDVAPYYWAMDMLVFPSYREGFGIVALEAQAASLPVICSDATGAIDAIVDGLTGIRVPTRDINAMTAAMSSLLDNEELRRRMGETGRAWVEKTFKREIVWQNLLQDYAALARRVPRETGSFPGRSLKRVLDWVISLPLLILTFPLWLVIALMVWIKLGSPVLFRQTRPGKKGRPFKLVKFRTMSDRRDAEGNLLPDADRLTRLGRFLRATSLDELPQFWNVLRGELSLVGPRPLLMDYLPRYSPEQARRHEVMPGITGWAQVNGRNAITWDEKFRLDVWYVDNWSIWLDFKILGLTLLKVIRREGVRNQGHATMPPFRGASSSASISPHGD
jgi:lipopolysaccharide/colanic/teichoic acid biosynthesis glycosyltransferase